MSNHERDQWKKIQDRRERIQKIQESIDALAEYCHTAGIRINKEGGK